MWSWLSKLVGTAKRPGPDQAERVLALEREAQQLRLELAEREVALAGVKGELECQRQGEQARILEAGRARTERLLSRAAAAVSQLEIQAHLLEREGKPVAARDVLTVAKRLIRALEDEGLTLEGKTGETVAFDPNYHQPLEVGPGLTPGQPVVIRSPGISYAGRVLHRAGVRKGGS